jgi:hypothetical protein
LRSIAIACACLAAFATAGQTAAADQCLTAVEVGDVGRMVSIMAMGAAVRRCAACLGPDRHPRAVQQYDSSGMLKDFWKAQSGLPLGNEKGDYIDTTVRSEARNYTAHLSGDCDACRRMADELDKLSTPEAREAFYKTETEELVKAHALKACP